MAGCGALLIEAKRRLRCVSGTPEGSPFAGLKRLELLRFRFIPFRATQLVSRRLWSSGQGFGHLPRVSRNDSFASSPCTSNSSGSSVPPMFLLPALASCPARLFRLSVAVLLALSHAPLRFDVSRTKPSADMQPPATHSKRRDAASTFCQHPATPRFFRRPDDPGFGFPQR